MAMDGEAAGLRVLPGQRTGPLRAPTPELRLAVYGAFFLSGATALVFQVLWSRQFVTVFGASTYAISVVLCAFMAGLGAGSWLGGRLADRFSRRLLMYGLIQVAVALWAAGIPLVLAALRRWAPGLGLLGPESLLVSTAARFLISFGILFVPCALMGATLPLLSRFCVESREVIGRRVSLLYGLNTLGAALGCFAAGYWMVDTLGLSLTNRVAVGANLFIGAGVLALDLGRRRGEAPLRLRPVSESVHDSRDSSALASAQEPAPGVGGLLLVIAFVSGLAALSCEVLWLRYLAPLSNMAYTFPTILGVYLLGIGIGSLICRLFLARLGQPLRVLAGAQLLLALTVVACFAVGAIIFSSPEVSFLALWQMTAITVFAPTMLMGIVFPLLCAAYTRSVSTVGRSIGVVYALNTVGAIIGSL
ncbi:MAG: fused MFS/spermidine synthase, partial [Candidatus Brocadiae bacterium]|nr:fused MFS/spermidine synthase [Candidatus Brocadiia bacterium]